MKQLSNIFEGIFDDEPITLAADPIETHDFKNFNIGRIGQIYKTHNENLKSNIILKSMAPGYEKAKEYFKERVTKAGAAFQQVCHYLEIVEKELKDYPFDEENEWCLRNNPYYEYLHIIDDIGSKHFEAWSKFYIVTVKSLEPSQGILIGISTIRDYLETDPPRGEKLMKQLQSFKNEISRKLKKADIKEETDEIKITWR